jgi:hypothetical protein
MELQQVNVKIFVDGELTVPSERFIEVFHNWIREKSVGDFLLDVADYRHVPKGPSVLLVGDEADFCMDQTGGRWGLLYNRKARLDGTNDQRLSQAFAAAAQACNLLEAEFTSEGPLRFSRHEFEIVINDRALATNTDETFEACKDDLEMFVTKTLGHCEYTFQRDTDPRRRFGVAVKSAKSFELSTLG